jgi:poly(A) polymerase Pap1
MCATFNITRSSMTIIQRELRRGLEISEEIMVGKRPWSDLFVKHTFFTQGYRYYISVVSASKNKEAHKVWSGYVESKVRMLVQKLEQHSSIALAHAFNKGYDRRHLCKNDHEIEQVQEGSLEFVIKDDDKAQPSEEKNPKPEEKEDGSASTSPVEVYTTTHYIGLELEEGMASHSPCLRLLILFLAILGYSMSWMLILQVPNLWIYHTKSMSSRSYVPVGRSMKMNCGHQCLWVYSTFESKPHYHCS